MLSRALLTIGILFILSVEIAAWSEPVCSRPGSPGAAALLHYGIPAGDSIFALSLTAGAMPKPRDEQAVAG